MAAHRSRALPFIVATAVAALGLVGSQQRGVAQEAQPVLIPTKDDGYAISQPPESAQKAPSGFVGQTDTSTLTAVGNTPATMGRRVVARFKLSNKIQTCPDGDGAAEGEGELSVTVDSTDQNENSSKRFVMQARAKYKGRVNDDAYLDGPVIAEIDYTQSSTIRGANGAFLSSPGGGAAQHVRIPFVVSRGMSSPNFGPFSGGDPSHGQVLEAYSVGMGLAYWAGIYYSEAQFKWRSGICAEVSFDPPSRTKRPPPRTEVKVKAHVKSKRGEIVKAHFQGVAFTGGSVNPPDGWSSDTLPLTFTYTAGTQQLATTGFKALATSRAGIAIADWSATLGTDWTGHIECSQILAGDSGQNEQQSWSYSGATRYSVDLQPGAAWARGYSDQRGFRQNLRPVVQGGQASLIFDNSDSLHGVAQGERQAIVIVELDTVKGTYQIKIEHRPFDPGQLQSVMCSARQGCQEQSLHFSVQSCLPPGANISGQFVNPNELSGSMDDVKTGLGRARNGTQTWHVSWHLSRQGTSR